MQLIADHGAIGVTLDRAQCFVQEAKTALLVFPDSPIRRALAGVADYTVQRLR
jgi:octaprenyl-diphosphate synthase